jgi:hypothetical protein
MQQDRRPGGHHVFCLDQLMALFRETLKASPPELSGKSISILLAEKHPARSSVSGQWMRRN